MHLLLRVQVDSRAKSIRVTFLSITFYRAPKLVFNHEIRQSSDIEFASVMREELPQQQPKGVIVNFLEIVKVEIHVDKIWCFHFFVAACFSLVACAHCAVEGYRGELTSFENFMTRSSANGERVNELITLQQLH